MQAAFRAVAASAVAALSAIANPAVAAPVTYTFSTDAASSSGSLSGAPGPSISLFPTGASGTFVYDSAAAHTFTAGDGSFIYRGHTGFATSTTPTSLSNLSGAAGANALTDLGGATLVGDDKFPSAGSQVDILQLLFEPPLTGTGQNFTRFEVGAFTAVGVRIFWIEGQSIAIAGQQAPFIVPDHLSGQALPAILPTFPGRLVLDFVETANLSSATAATFFVFFDNLQVSAALHGATPKDFNADGRADVFWRNTGPGGTGENYLYPMDGTSILPSEGYVRTVADLDWQIAGIGDFNADGKADLLWRNSSTGENYVYMMEGTVIIGEGYLRTVADQNWRVGGIGDFDGDGKEDILWRHDTTGENYLYPMNGLEIKATEGYIRTVADTTWKIAGVGDLDGDGKADILWRHSSSGENYVYPMDGVTTKPTEGYLRTVSNPAWQVAGLGDFDGDGKADIVWRNADSGENYIYLIDACPYACIKPSEGFFRTVPDAAWTIAAVGDYDGDGKSDLFWRNVSTGENYVYPMEGTSIKPTEGHLRSVAPGNWSIIKN